MRESIICTTGWPLIWRLIKELWKSWKREKDLIH